VYINEQIPVSVSVASNIDGYEGPMCIVNEDPKRLLRDFASYVMEAASKFEEGERLKYKHVLDEYERQIAISKGPSKEFGKLMFQLKTLQKEEGTDAARATVKARMEELLEDPMKLRLRELTSSLFRFEQRLQQLPLLSFNGAKFDLPLVKKHLIPALMELYPADPRKRSKASKITAIKGGGKYKSLSVKNLRFLDVLQYLPPCTYAKFVDTYTKNGEKKGVFPYGWLTDFSLLDSTTALPPIDAFYNELTGKHCTLDEYKMAEDQWRENDCRTMRDYLVAYNNKDVGPMLDGVETMRQYWRESGLDMLRDGQSLPGLALRDLFTDLPSMSYVPRMAEVNKDMHEMLKNNIVGGPSIVYHREHTALVTKIRKRPDSPEHLVRRILGFDANSLYLWCTMQEMPTYPWWRWRPDPKKPEQFKVSVVRPSCRSFCTRLYVFRETTARS
jgi:hypothetical protein